MNGYELRLEPYCNFCKDFVPEVDSLYFNGLCKHSIHCAHKDRCANIANNIKNKLLTDRKDD